MVEARERRELAAELEQRGRALGLALRRLVQARVLDRHRSVPGEHLEQPDVVLVELVETELGDDDHAHDAAAVAQRHGDERFLDQRRALDAMPELAVGRIPDEQRFAAHGALPGHADADADAQKLEGKRDWFP